MSTLEVNSIQPLSSGTTVTLGASGKTLSIPSGCTITNSGTATGFGAIIQYKTAKNNTQFDTSSYTFAEMDSNLRLTITPTSASNKLIISLNLMWLDINSGGRGTIVRFMRSIDGGTDTNIGSDDGGTVDMFYNWDAGRYQRPVKYTYIDTTHNTTSSIVYKFFAGTDAGNTVRFGASTRYSTTEVMEIA